MPNKPLKTVIGSYPMDFDKIGLVAIREAVNDQLKAGIDLVTDGQTRTDMISYFAKSIDGFKGGAEKPKIAERIGEVHPSVIIKDFRMAKMLLPEDKAIKGILTGPVTLAFSSTIETPEYKGFRDEKLYMDIADALLKIGKELEKEGATWIQIDEPFYSVGAPMELAKRAVEHITAGLHVPVALHVCGDVTKVYKRLVEFEGIDLLSHAFMGFPSNLKVLEKEALTSHKKRVGLGCIDTQKVKIESSIEVAALVRQAVEKVGWENLVFHPDCGLRALKRDIALAKLTAMVEGVNTAWQATH
jgi:5-methyltetrahydropteroyltriglutamate--homocysteine methyltransferase